MNSKKVQKILEKSTSKEVLEHFDVDFVNLKALKFLSKDFGVIDFTTMTKSQAENLRRRGFPYLSLKIDKD